MDHIECTGGPAVRGLFSDDEGGAPAGRATEEEAAGVARDDVLAAAQPAGPEDADAQKLALLEAVVYITDEPLTVEQIAEALGEPEAEARRLLERLVAEYSRPEHGLSVREIAGGYKMSTKPEHHEAIRAFVKKLNPPLKLSLAALETLAVIAYKQPITAPEIMEIRGVQGAGVLKTLLDRKLITTAGRKSVVGRPILYRTTKEFLVQFGLKDLSELPTLKEFEELRRLALTDEAGEETAPAESAAEPLAADAQQPGDTADLPAASKDEGAPEDPRPPAPEPPENA